MRVDNITIKPIDSTTTEVSARIRSKLLREDFRLYFRFDSKFTDFVTDYGDPFLLAVLPICSYHGEEISIDAPVTRELLDRIPGVVDKFQELFSTFSHVQIHCEVASAPHPWNGRKRLTAAFFSLGLDSLYTFAKNRKDIDVLIIRASDMEQWGPDFLNEVVIGTRSTIRKLDSHAEVLVVKTNSCQLAQGLVDTELHYIGASQASLAYLFSSGILRTFVAAGHPLDFLQPISFHPDFDRLWSSECMQIIHDSPIRRLDKALGLAQQPELVEHMRVCLHSYASEFNCGWCSKCLSTSISLHVAGILDRCKTLPHQIRVERIPHLVTAAKHIGWLDWHRWVLMLGNGPEDLRLKAAILEWRTRTNENTENAFLADRDRAWELAKRGRFSEAKALHRRLLEIDPYDDLLNFHMGCCIFWSEGNPDEARYFFEKAREYWHNEYFVTYQLFLLSLSSGHFSDGIALLRDAHRMRPKGFWLHAGKDAVRWLLLKARVYERVMGFYHGPLNPRQTD